MRRHALALQPAHDHVQHGVRERVVLPRRPRGQVRRVRGRVHHRHRRRREQRRAPLHRELPHRQVRAARTVGARHVRRLEAHHLVRTELQVARTGHRRQVVGVRHTDRRPRLRRREGPQTDPVRQVRVQPAQLALLQPLRGQQQVHAQRTADAADLDEHVDEVGLRRQQLAELVDDQHQRRQRLQRGAGRAGLLVVVDVRVVARRTQQLLTALQLAADRVAHAVHEREVVREVGDDRRDVRHLAHAGEGRAALEVGEHEVQRLRGVRDRQPQHQRAQQLRLARTGRTHAQAVRAHALLRGLLEVQHDRRTVLADADRHAQPLTGGPRPPGPRHVDRGRVAQVQQVREVQVRQQRLVVVPAARAQRRQLPGEGLRRGQRQGVRHTLVRDPATRLQTQPARPHHDRQTTARLVQLARDHLDDGDALQALGRGEHRVRGHHAAVQHDHQVRLVQHRGHVTAEPRTPLQPGRQHPLQLGEVVAEQPLRTGPVDLPRQLRVRQPLRPVPRGHRTRRGHHRHHQVLGGVQRRQLRDQRPRRAARRLRLPGHRHVVEGPHRHRHRQPVQRGVHLQEALHRTRRQRLQLVHRRRLRRHQRRRQALRAQPQPGLPEVGVADPPLPQPRTVRHHRPQLLRRRVQIQLRVALRPRRPTHLTARLGEVFEVVPAHVGHLPLRTAPEAHQLRHDHSHRRRQHQHAHDAHEGGRARHEEEDDGRAHAEHRQELHQHALLLPARQFGRSFQPQLLRGNLGRQGPRRAFDDDLAHRSINPSKTDGTSQPAPPSPGREGGIPHATVILLADCRSYAR